MKHSEELRQQLHSIHRRSYPAYKDLKGQYSFGNYILSIDHVQGDPFASPSHISVRIAHKDAAFPQEYYKDTLSRATAGRKSSPELPAKSAKTESTPDFLSASLQTAAPSMPLSWKKSSLNFFRSVSARHSFIPARTPVT